MITDFLLLMMLQSLAAIFLLPDAVVHSVTIPYPSINTTTLNTANETSFNNQASVQQMSWEEAASLASFYTVVAVIPGFIVLYLLCINCPKFLNTMLDHAV
uniref:Cnidarian restricted protein n=1 Tax=Clytia hemisphaerica TaxID=252671 RepID=A0A7M5WU86_9CNID